MKKLIYGGLLIAAVGIGFIGCEKDITETNDKIENSQDNKLSISLQEFQNILSINNAEKAGPGWEKFKKWVKAHTGNTQRYNDGQAVCMGNGGCGPCPGVCFGSTMYDGGDNGELTDEEYNLGLRAISLSILESSNEYLLLIAFPTIFENEFISNDIFIIDDTEYLPDFYSTEAGYSAIAVEPGNYPVIQNQDDSLTYTIVNIGLID
jgi:hypothetical protein